MPGKCFWCYYFRGDSGFPWPTCPQPDGYEDFCWYWFDSFHLVVYHHLHHFICILSLSFINFIIRAKFFTGGFLVAISLLLYFCIWIKLCLVLEFNVSLSPNQLRYLGNSRVDWEVYMLLFKLCSHKSITICKPRGCVWHLGGQEYCLSY